MLDPAFSGLTGVIPPEIGNLVNLGILKLQNNQLTGDIPSEIGNLTNLGTLKLQNNQLISIPESICNIYSNLVFTVNNNSICGTLPSCLTAEDIGEQDCMATTNTVSIANSAFNPSTLTISIGETVTWTLTNGTHTVVSDDESWQSGSLSTGGTFTHQFDTAGEFGYKCGIHSSMTGAIIVQ